ncbi:hypothetical protein CBR_g68709 [Chara braunii]|uniref:Uncharacterized protein n=1 Tax=Chara braunii TaxID=69332 RepID=A0A388K9J6_CHABU|nr:hypothetical protein CBR_g68709 [Chara braunii]|eukprot:GBG66725.1 hypothetical protein CBR_g68709 [Chara braunii]
MENDGHICPPEFDWCKRVASPGRTNSSDALTARLDELGQSVASLSEFVGVELARRNEKEKKKREKEERRRLEEEEQEREAERIEKAAAEARKKEEEQLAMAKAKAVEIQLALRIGSIRDEIRSEIRRAISEGKAVVTEDTPSTSGTATTSEEEVAAITEGAEKLSIVEKRKRGEDVSVADSPPVTTPAKRTSKRPGVRPIRLSDRLQRARAKISRKNVRTPVKALTAVKRPPDMAMERLSFLDLTCRELSQMDYEKVRRICRIEGVPYTTKMQAIFDLAEWQATLRFGKEEEQSTALVNIEDGEEGSSSEGVDETTKE